MESSTVGDWDAQWTTHHLAGSTSWLDAYAGGGADVVAAAGIFEPAQQQLAEGNAVDQLLLERIMADFAANTDSDPSGQTFDLDCLLSTTTATTSTTAETSPDPVEDSGSFSQPVWKAPRSGLSSSCNNKKRKRDPNPEQFRLLGSEYDYPSSGFKLIREAAKPGNPPSNISFQPSGADADAEAEPDAEAIQQMKEMIYRAAAFRPVNLGEEPAEKPRRKNVRISSDPQTVAARQRRERISERLRVLQKLVPGGSKMDTASMLDEAANYLKFLRAQVKALEAVGTRLGGAGAGSSSASCSLANGVAPSVSLDFSSFGGGFSMVPPNYSMQMESHHRQNPNANALLLLQQYAKS